MPGFHIFHRGHANFPWRSHADWFVAQMVRWRQVGADVDASAVADRVFRPDLYRAAARAMGIDCPAEDRKPDGAHGEPAVPPVSDRSSPAEKVSTARGAD
jgi:hypothetical protein